MPSLHLFDVDFTIVKSSTVKEFLFAAFPKRIISWTLLFHLPRFYFLLTAAKGGPGSIDKRFRILAGLDKKVLDDMAASVFRSRVRATVDPVIKKKIEDLQNQGHKVGIASSSFKFIIQPLADYLSIETIIATELDFSKGISTGKIAGIPAFSEGKKLKVLQFLSETGLNAHDCVFYSDSQRDMPLLSLVGKAVAVNPQRKLRRLAERRGWEIIDT
jgi:HAD superfamily hydrolase (TIGR01490 family)